MRKISLIAAATAVLVASTVAASAGVPCPRDMFGNRIVVAGCGYNSGYGGGYYVQQQPRVVMVPRTVYVDPNAYYGRPDPDAAFVGAIAGGIIGGALGAIAGSR